MKVGEFSVETKGLFGHEIRCHEVNGEKDFLLRLVAPLYYAHDCINSN